VSISSSGGPEPSFRKSNSPRKPESLDQLSPESSAASATSKSMSSNESPTPSGSLSPISLFQRAQKAWPTRRSLAVPPMRAKTLSTQTRSSKPSTKPQGPPAKESGATADAGDRPWRVRLHPKVAKQIAGYSAGTASPLFRQTIGAIIEALKTDPKQYGKKKGTLKDARAADLRYNDGITYRAVFTIDEGEHAVDVLALDPYDKAYQVASNRI